MKKQDPYSRENMVAAINLVCPDMTPTEKRAIFKTMTADVEQLTIEAKRCTTQEPNGGGRCRLADDDHDVHRVD